jgi:hypothetical protein
MSSMCDGCKLILDENDGYASISIRDPSPDFSVDAPRPTFRVPPKVDLCADCIVKMIAALDLPTSTFQPRPKPAEPAAPAGALSDADLADLGLKDP